MQALVFITDEGSEFKGPIDKVWALANSEANHKHSFQKNVQVKMEGQNPILSYDAQTPSGGWVRQSIKITYLPPLGYTLEYLDGDMAGSKAMSYYVPKGSKTGINVIGEWTSKSVPPDQLKKMVLKNLETAFNEDQENLKKM